MRRRLRVGYPILLALLVTLLSGCAAPWPFPQPTPDHSKLPDAQQIFRPLEIGPNAGDLATIDPALINFGVDYQLAQLLFPGLVTLDEQNRVVDWAAESHEVSADGLTYTFHLHTGMQWSDGTPIDAATFAYSINRALDPCTGSDVASYLYNIKGAAEFNGGYPFKERHCPTGAKVSADTLIGKSIVVADPLTLKLTLEAPAGYFLASLTYPTSWAVPQSLVERYTTPTPAPPRNGGLYPLPTSVWTEHLVDNGGFGGNLFKLAAWQHPDGSATRAQTPVLGAPTATPTPIPPADIRGEIVFTRNDRFWGQKPALKEVHYTLFKDISALWASYKDGASDVGLPYPAAGQIDVAKTLKDSTFHQTPQLAFSYLALQWNKPPFDDVRMRQAFSLALDRQAITHDSLKDTAQPTIHLIPDGIPGYNPDVLDAAGRKGKDALTPDPATARRLANEYAAEKCGGALAKCPPVGILITANRPTTTALIQAMKSQWETAFPGLVLNIYTIDRSGYLWPYQITNASWGADYPDPQDFTSLLWTTSTPYNKGRVSIPQVDQLCAQAARIPLYQQAEQLLITQGAAIPYARPLTSYVVRSRVVGWSIAPSGQTPLSVWQTTYLTR
jgi:oligopeptide transport system substrate-binding protein